MKSYIEERVLSLANYIIDRKATVRQTGKRFSVSKSTVHKDVADRLKYINHNLYEEVRVILEYNKAERHLRGGKATKEKFILNRPKKD